MKTIISLLVVMSAMLFSGCMSCVSRCAEGASYYKTAGTNGREHPYRATKEIWDCVCLPFEGCGRDPFFYSFVCVTWPFWLVDDVLEGAVDTVLLPVDLIGMSCSREADVKIDTSKEGIDD